jgi:hypothetical protein
MSEALTKNAADKLVARRAEIASTLEGLAGDNRNLALQAALGDQAAARRLTRHQARANSLASQLTALDAALAQAASNEEAAASASRAQQRADQKRHLDSLLHRRRDLSAEIDAALRRLALQIAALDAASAEIGSRGHDQRFAVSAFNPLGREATGGRLAEFMAGIGFDAWLPLSRPEIRPAIADLAAAEQAAQGIFRAGLGEVAP